jgi:hypothetical protein
MSHAAGEVNRAYASLLLVSKTNESLLLLLNMSPG